MNLYYIPVDICSFSAFFVLNAESLINLKNMPDPHWFHLTKRLKDLREIQNGLTIPFLYGAYLQLDYKIKSIEDLLIEILNTPAIDLPVIEMCDVIKFHVLQLEAPAYVNRYRKNEVKIIFPESSGRMVISYNSQLGSTIKQVANALRGIYQKPIDDGTFSWNNQHSFWRPFNDKERAVIEQIR